MPEVGIFDAPEMNAFATGARRDSALVHVANGDMVTLALIQGVLNTFVIFLARAIGTLLDSALGAGRGEQRRTGPGPFYFVIVIVLQVVLGIFASIIVMGLSRRREFRADAGGARLAGTGNMIGALERLQAAHSAALPAQG